MDPNLLDDKNVDTEHRNSLLTELGKVEIWLSILAAFGFVAGAGLFFVAMTALEDEHEGVFFLGVLLMGLVGLVFYWSNTAFKYTRVIKWYDPELITTRLEHLFEDNSRLWRATALLFFWLFGTLAYVLYGGFFG
jgi:hypothetical protein